MRKGTLTAIASAVLLGLLAANATFAGQEGDRQMDQDRIHQLDGDQIRDRLMDQDFDRDRDRLHQPTLEPSAVTESVTVPDQDQDRLKDQDRLQDQTRDRIHQ